jgi:RNA polymerase sigma-70 factor (ECF subfamily)
MIQTEHILAVQTAIGELSEDHRAILVLRDMHGMSYEDIAEVLQTPIGTVRSRLNRARMQLKVQLEKRPGWRQ